MIATAVFIKQKQNPKYNSKKQIKEKKADVF